MTEQVIGKVMMTFKGNYDTTKQYDYLDVVTDQGSSFVCLSNDVTSKPSELSNDWQLIAKVGATPDTSNFALKQELPDLTPYALKEDVPTIPSDLVHAADLKAVSDIANNAKSEADSNSKAIANKADKGDIPTSMSWDNITNKPQLATLSDIPTMPDLSGYATISSLINYVKKTDLPDFTQFARVSDIPKQMDLSGYAKKSDIPDMTKYALKSAIPSLDGYAKLTDIPSVSGLVKEAELNEYAKKSELPDLSQYALKKDIPNTVDTSSLATKDEVQKAQSTADAANKFARNDAQLIKQVNTRIDNLKIPDASTLNQVVTITSGTLADLANKKGSYHYEIECIPSDTPIEEWGLCDVVVGEHYAKEIYTVSGATDDNQANEYVRVRNWYGEWSNWREVTLWQ